MQLESTSKPDTIAQRVIRFFGLTPASSQLAWAIAGDMVEELGDPVLAEAMRKGLYRVFVPQLGDYHTPTDGYTIGVVHGAGINPYTGHGGHGSGSGEGYGDGSGYGDGFCGAPGDGHGYGAGLGSSFGCGDGDGTGR